MRKQIHRYMLFLSVISMSGILLPKNLFCLWFFVPTIFLFCHLLAGRLTKQITESINSIDQDSSSPKAYDELSPFMKTIARQKEQIEWQIRTLENRATMIKMITHGMNEGLILLDKEGVILSVNFGATALFSDNPEQIDYTGKNILELTRDISILETIKEAFQGNHCNTVLQFGIKTVQVFLNPVFQDDEVNGVIILFLDITEKSNAEKNRREFSANVSHELKTPLTTILGLSEMLGLRMANSEDVAGFAKKINTEVLRLINLINDIIRLSELDENAGEKQLEHFDLSELANEIANSLRQTAHENGITLEVSGDSIPITANKRMIDELLYNLIDNGIKYNKKGGLVTVSLSREKAGAAISVSDTGTGIPKEHMERVFERFYRVDKSRSKKTGGTGLGLSIVKHIAQYHNGHVELKSKENEGTTVTIVLPEKIH